MFAVDLSYLRLEDVASIFVDVILLEFDAHQLSFDIKEKDNTLIQASWLGLWCTWINAQQPAKADLPMVLDS